MNRIVAVVGLFVLSGLLMVIGVGGVQAPP